VPAEITEDGFAFNLTLEPQSEWETCIDVRPITEETVEAVKYGHDAEDAHPNMALTLEEWVEDAPVLACDSDDLQHVYRKSLVDLAALRFYSILFPSESKRPDLQGKRARECPQVDARSLLVFPS
jgi:hypothetical protein